MDEDRIKRGNVFIADLDPTIGSEQYGRRPVVILSNDKQKYKAGNRKFEKNIKK